MKVGALRLICELKYSYICDLRYRIISCLSDFGVRFKQGSLPSLAWSAWGFLPCRHGWRWTKALSYMGISLIRVPFDRSPTQYGTLLNKGPQNKNLNLENYPYDSYSDS